MHDVWCDSDTCTSASLLSLPRSPSISKVYTYKLPQFDEYLAKYPSCRDSQWSGDVKLVEWLRGSGDAYSTNNPDEADFLLV
jgi:hypothetical protein